MPRWQFSRGGLQDGENTGLEVSRSRQQENHGRQLLSTTGKSGVHSGVHLAAKLPFKLELHVSISSTEICEYVVDSGCTSPTFYASGMCDALSQGILRTATAAIVFLVRRRLVGLRNRLMHVCDTSIDRLVAPPRADVRPTGRACIGRGAWRDAHRVPQGAEEVRFETLCCRRGGLRTPGLPVCLRATLLLLLRYCGSSRVMRPVAHLV